MDKTFRQIFLAAAVAIPALLAGCKEEAPKSVILAQVGESSLTLDALRESFPAEFEQLIRREQYLEFIKRWMDDEAVYQQAVKSKLDGDPLVSRKLEKLRRKLLIEEFLARENSADVFEPDEMAMNQYYEMHKEEFRRKSPEYKVAHIRAQTNKQATELRSKANRGDFLAVAATSSLDPAPESYASIGFKQQTEFPPCLSQDIGNAGVGNVSQPIACADGFYLVKVLEKQDAGSLIPFAEAKEEISGILILDRKDKLLERRVAKIKEGLEVSYHLDQIPGLAAESEGYPTPSAVTPTHAPAADAPAAPPAAVNSVAPAPPPAAAANARLPREPDVIPSTGNTQSGSTAPAAVSPANAVPKIPPRKRVTRPAASSRIDGDSLDAKMAAKTGAEPVPDYPAPKPETEENADAQNPTPVP